jgi:hypothetical protein
MKIGIPDFDKVETGREPLPPGQYSAICTGCKSGKSSQKQTPQIEWEFTIQGPTHSGRKVFDQTFLSEKALFTTKTMVVGVGASFDNTGFTTEDCLGKRVTLTLGQKKDDNGNISPYNTIERVKPL